MDKYNSGIHELIEKLGVNVRLHDFINYLTKPIDNIHDSYINYEVFSSGIHINEPLPVKKNNKRVGILLQGPILHKLDFTKTTVKLYLELFDNPLIVISTWNNDDTSAFDEFNKDNVLIIKSDPPKQKGFLNLNNQIVSTIRFNYTKKTRCGICI